MNRKLCLFAGKSDYITKGTLQSIFPNSSQVICRERVSFITFETATEAVQVLQYQSVNVGGVNIKISWAQGSYNADMLPGQLEREKKKAEEEQAKQKASQPQNVSLAAVTYVSAQQNAIGYQGKYAPTVGYQGNYAPTVGYQGNYAPTVSYQGNYAPTYQLVGQVMQPGPLVNQNVTQGVPVTMVMQPTTAVALAPSNQMGQQPMIPLNGQQAAPGGVPSYVQSNAMTVVPQMMSQTGQPMHAQIGPLPSQVIAPPYQGQFYGPSGGQQ